MMASVALGLGLGVEGLMKREVAGPVPFLISGLRGVRRDSVERGKLADCSHCFCRGGAACACNRASES